MTQHIRFIFADGFKTILPADTIIRLRNAEHYGVQQWTADFLAAGQFPSAPPFTEWLFVEATGVEHFCRDMTATRGEMKPAAEVVPVAAAPVVDTEMEVPGPAGTSGIQGPPGIAGPAGAVGPAGAAVSPEVRAMIMEAVNAAAPQPMKVTKARKAKAV